jgi:hypothetical protein
MGYCNSRLLQSISVDVQLDVEVVFEYPDVSNVGAVTEEAKFNALDSSQDGYEHRGMFGPFGLLILTDESLQEQTAVFFYIAQSSDGQWTTRFCNDQSRYAENSKRRHSKIFFGVSENAHFLPARYTMELIHFSNLLISTEKLKNENN